MIATGTSRLCMICVGFGSACKCFSALHKLVSGPGWFPLVVMTVTVGGAKENRMQIQTHLQIYTDADLYMDTDTYTDTDTDADHDPITNA